jgi:REP element-mobilizing transposase RayT
LWNIIWAFKSETTNAYIKLVYQSKANSFNKKLWQRNFYEHIIRNEKEYFKIVEYIENNVEKWEEDKFYYTEI